MIKFPESLSAEDKGVFFHTIGISFSLKDKSSIKNWLSEVISLEKEELGAVHYYFCGDEKQRDINIKYLNHDNYTDVISFQYDQLYISGDIFISVDRVRENAEVYSSNFKVELRRVLVHGVLHFIGYSDKSPKKKLKMRKKEDEYLNLWDLKYAKSQ